MNTSPNEIMSEAEKVHTKDDLLVRDTVINQQEDSINVKIHNDEKGNETTSNNEPTVNVAENCNIGANEGLVIKVEVDADTEEMTSIRICQDNQVSSYVTTVKTEDHEAIVSSIKVEDSVKAEEIVDDMAAVEDVKTEGHQFTEIKIKDADSDMDPAMAYRTDREGGTSDSSEDSDSDSSTSSASSSPLPEQRDPHSDNDDDEDDDKPGKRKKKQVNVVRTRGELFPEDLPPIEDLKISVDETVEIREIGTVASVVGVLVVVKANKDVPPLNEETVLFNETRDAFGKIFEVFGPVLSPFYSVRFNSHEDIVEKKIVPGLPIYCAPGEQEYTQFVFVDQLRRIKGSDASWENNNEPPSACLDYSDDESERKTKAKNRNKNKTEDDSQDDQTKKGRNKKKPRKFEGEMGNNHDVLPNTNPRGRGRGQRQGPQVDSWPPKTNTGWPSRHPDAWGLGPSEWAQRQFTPQAPFPFTHPGNLPGNRGTFPQGQTEAFSHQGQGQFGNFIHQGQGDTFLQGPPPGRLPHYMNRQQRGPPPFGGMPFPTPPNPYAQPPGLVDNRLIQNQNNMDAPLFHGSPHPQSTFGGQPQFSPGPMQANYKARPGPPGRW